MKLSKLILYLFKFRLQGIKYVNFWISFDYPPNECYNFLISDKTITLKNWEDFEVDRYNKNILRNYK